MGAKANNDGLFCELYWGTTLNEARGFGPEEERVLAAPDETVPLPLYGFTLPEEPFVLAERTEGGYRVYVPPAARVERSQRGDAFRPVRAEELQRTGERAWVVLAPDDKLRLLEKDLSLVLTHSVAGKRPASLGLKDIGWLAVVSALFLSLPVGFLIAGPTSERMAESNARAIAGAREREQAERKRLGVDTPPHPLTPRDAQAPDAGTGTGTKVVPANLGVH